MTGGRKQRLKGKRVGKNSVNTKNDFSAYDPFYRKRKRKGGLEGKGGNGEM